MRRGQSETLARMTGTKEAFDASTREILSEDRRPFVHEALQNLPDPSSIRRLSISVRRD